MQYKVQDETIKINTNEAVFTPSEHGSRVVGGAIYVVPGETVVDIGTGTGLLAIFTAKKGGIVDAVDINEKAVSLTKENALLYNVAINVFSGDLFSPLKNKKYDVIIANVPQEQLSPTIRANSSNDFIVGIDGDEGGNKILLKILKNAHVFMHENSRLYIAIYCMTFWKESFSFINEFYNAKILSFSSGKVKDYVYKDIPFYEHLAKEGKINFYKKGDEYWSDIFMLELRIK